MNGNKTVFALLSLVGALLIALAGFVLHNFDGRLGVLEARYSDHLSDAQVGIERRLTGAESQLAQGRRFTREDWDREYERLDARIRRLERRAGIDTEGP